ncbi:DNA/RNA helicase domain-containing protein [Ruminococcus sp.]|uniref:DNA/RNA helicase domain-containing protein n=1 Tax=Ruminococcus sp. TaxID=41978 RepID=UPI0025EFDB51|nr:DNA/RNA helicase domain-containing protein [Ruminococcus sp.]
MICAYLSYRFLIVGDDLLYREGKVITDYTRHPKGSGEFRRPHQRKPTPEDSDIIDQLIRNTYKVLFTRGQKGLYLYIMDEALREYLKTEIQKIYDMQAILRDN